MKALVLLFALVVSCGGVQRPASPEEGLRAAINGAAHALSVTDTAADGALRMCGLTPECAQKFVALARSETVAYNLLLAAEHSMDAVKESGDKCHVKDAVNDAFLALQNVASALSAAGVPAVQELSAAIPALSQAAQSYAPVCPSGVP